MTDVSIVVPAHQATGTIGAMLRSLVSEKDLIREVIVVDDSSSDGTAETAASLAAELSLPVTIITANCRDSGAARNIGMASATGAWLYFLDADDEHVSGGLRVLVEKGTSSPDIDIVVGAYQRSVDGSHRRTKHPARFGSDALDNAERYLSGEIRSMAVGSVIVRRASIGTARFPVSVPYDEDTIFWAQLLRHAQVATVSRTIMVYRLSTDRANRRFLVRPSERFDTWRSSLATLCSLGISPDALAVREGIVALKIARVHYAQGDWRTAASFLAIARSKPRSWGVRYRSWRYRMKLALRHRLAAGLGHG